MQSKHSEKPHHGTRVRDRVSPPPISHSCTMMWSSRMFRLDGKASLKAIPVERHGKAVMECVMETARRVASWKGVTEINICLASRKRRHGRRHGDSKVRSVLERRYGKRYWWSVMEKAVMECITETARRAASRKGVTEINICLA